MCVEPERKREAQWHDGRAIEAIVPSTSGWQIPLRRTPGGAALARLLSIHGRDESRYRSGITDLQIHIYLESVKFTIK